MLPVILTLLASTAAVPAVAEAPSQDPAVRVWLNKSGYVERTDKVRAYVRTGVDGYVTILHAEPSGRVRVLFPLDPDDDAWVRAGQDYEIRSRSDKEAFAVYDGSGLGVVLAAVGMHTASSPWPQTAPLPSTMLASLRSVTSTYVPGCAPSAWTAFVIAVLYPLLPTQPTTGSKEFIESEIRKKSAFQLVARAGVNGSSAPGGLIHRSGSYMFAM